jgi:hypothetical protein
MSLKYSDADTDSGCGISGDRPHPIGIVTGSVLRRAQRILLTCRRSRFWGARLRDQRSGESSIEFWRCAVAAQLDPKHSADTSCGRSSLGRVCASQPCVILPGKSAWRGLGLRKLGGHRYRRMDEAAADLLERRSITLDMGAGRSRVSAGWLFLSIADLGWQLFS